MTGFAGGFICVVERIHVSGLLGLEHNAVRSRVAVAVCGQGRGCKRPSRAVVEGNAPLLTGSQRQRRSADGMNTWLVGGEGGSARHREAVV